VSLMGSNTHYEPAPWVDNLTPNDTNPVYFENANTMGIGFDRTSTRTEGHCNGTLLAERNQSGIGLVR
jgi:hypothetical protein